LVPEPGALLGVPVDPLLRRVHVDERQHLAAGQQRRLAGQPGQHPAGHRIQLPDIAPGERPQK